MSNCRKVSVVVPCMGANASSVWVMLITVPIYQTATYVFRNTQELIDFKEGRIEKGEYGRYGNPTVHAARAQAGRTRTR